MKGKDKTLDKKDFLLLQLLQQDTLLTSYDLGEAVGLSPTAAKRRVHRMRSSGMIQQDVAVLNSEKLGFQIFTLVLVNLEKDRRDLLDNFKRAIQSNSRVLSAFYTTGEVDFVLLVVSRDLKHYEAFTREFLLKELNLKYFKTMVVLEKVKMTTTLPIEDELI